MEDEIIAVTIEDDSRQTIAFAPNDPPQLRIDLSPVAIFQSLRDPAFEKIEIEILPLPGKSARHNLRLGIVNGAADQFVASVLERDHVAVLRFAKNFQDFTGKDPVVAVKNSRAGFDD